MLCICEQNHIGKHLAKFRFRQSTVTIKKDTDAVNWWFVEALPLAAHVCPWQFISQLYYIGSGQIINFINITNPIEGTSFRSSISSFSRYITRIWPNWFYRPTTDSQKPLVVSSQTGWKARPCCFLDPNRLIPHSHSSGGICHTLRSFEENMGESLEIPWYEIESVYIIRFSFCSVYIHKYIYIYMCVWYQSTFILKMYSKLYSEKKRKSHVQNCMESRQITQMISSILLLINHQATQGWLVSPHTVNIPASIAVYTILEASNASSSGVTNFTSKSSAQKIAPLLSSPGSHWNVVVWRLY